MTETAVVSHVYRQLHIIYSLYTQLQVSRSGAVRSTIIAGVIVVRGVLVERQTGLTAQTLCCHGNLRIVAILAKPRHS
jgi:hypothetical protein